MLSFTVARMAPVDEPSATIIGEPDVTDTVPMDDAAEIRVIFILPVVPFVDVAFTVSVPALVDAV